MRVEFWPVWQIETSLSAQLTDPIDEILKGTTWYRDEERILRFL